MLTAGLEPWHRFRRRSKEEKARAPRLDFVRLLFDSDFASLAFCLTATSGLVRIFIVCFIWVGRLTETFFKRGPKAQWCNYTSSAVTTLTQVEISGFVR